MIPEKTEKVCGIVGRRLQFVNNCDNGIFYGIFFYVGLSGMTYILLTQII